MKKLFIAAAVILCCVGLLTGCKSQAERDYEKAAQNAELARDMADKARQRSEELNRDIAEYQAAVDRLNSFN